MLLSLLAAALSAQQVPSPRGSGPAAAAPRPVAAPAPAGSGAVFPSAVAPPAAAVPRAGTLPPVTTVEFRSFPWGTSMTDFIAKQGKPVHQDEIDGLKSLIYENIEVSGYSAYMVVYFSKTGLAGGTYYFLTNDLDDLMKCYREVQQELLNRYGSTRLCDGIMRELRPYESSWNLEGAYVYLKVNTRQGEPVTLWYSSPALTKQLGL
jgi:hypothetical protein